MIRHTIPKQPMQRFIEFVRINDAGCWIWTGAHGEHGYGDFGLNGKVARAHRWSFEQFKAPIPDGMDVLHSCDVRDCVNPDHLFVGTHMDNMRDAMAKGRFAVNENAGAYRGKMTDEIAQQIRQMRAAGHRNVDIARRFGISPGYCCWIAMGKNWPAKVERKPDGPRAA